MALEKPKSSSGFAQNELDKAESQFKEFDEGIKALTMDRMNEAPKVEAEPQTKLSTNEIANSKDIYLKPKRRIASREKFNERFRQAYEYDKEYVRVIAEHKELIGESIPIWTKPYAGIPAEEWDVPSNKPIWMPRYLAEQIKRKYYHRLVMKESNSAGSDGFGSYYGTMAADTTVARLDCTKAPETKTLFMGAKRTF